MMIDDDRCVVDFCWATPSIRTDRDSHHCAASVC